jgi:hypothetical protein
MKNFVCNKFTLVLALSVAVGCGGGGSSPPTEPSPTPEVTSDAQLKERLQYIAESGGMGSAFAGIKELCEKSGKPALVADAQKLESAQSPEAAKAIAKGMLGKL